MRTLIAAYDAGRLSADARRVFLTAKIAEINRQIWLLEKMRSNFARELSQLR